MSGTSERDEQLPGGLVDELKRLDRAPAMVTSRVDRSLSATARAHFASRQAPRWQQQRAWGAAAACALLVALFTTSRLEEEVETSTYADIDGSGRIDIADVLALARSGQGVDQAHLDAFAFRLVALDGDGGAP